MRTKQRGMFAPLVVMIGTVLMLLWLPSIVPLSSQMQKLRYQHATWWFWQQAVIRLQRETGIWPANLHAVAQHFALGDVPQFLQGEGWEEQFELRWIGLSASDTALLQELDTAATMTIVEHTVVATLTDAPTKSLSTRYLPRKDTATMDTSLSLGGHQLTARHVNAEQVQVVGDTYLRSIKVAETETDELHVDGAFKVYNFSRHPLLLDEIVSLKDQIDSLLALLRQHLNLPEGELISYLGLSGSAAD